jgi:hypothetical protein
MRFEVLMTVTIKSTIFWDVSLVDVYQHLKSKSKPSKQAVLGTCFTYSLALREEGEFSSK